VFGRAPLPGVAVSAASGSRVAKSMDWHEKGRPDRPASETYCSEKTSKTCRNVMVSPHRIHYTAGVFSAIEQIKQKGPRRNENPP